MKFIKPFLGLLLFVLCLPAAGQTPTFEELEFEPDSVTAAYKPSGKNYVLIRSKRGTSGVNKTASADAILNAEVSEIVLVYSELNSSDLAEREEANRERWENLLKTYPELFQFSTTYKNLCQCNARGDAEAFKQSQGFYVYVNGEVPKVEEPKAEPVVKAKTEDKKPEVKPVVTEKPVAVADRTEVKPKEPAPAVKETPAPAAVKETPAKAEVTKPAAAPTVAKEPPPPAKPEVTEKAPAVVEAPEVAKEAPKKKAPVSTKPRRAKDPKSCRPPCYEGGDEDLNTFFKDNITLSKKQKKKGKNLEAVVKLQLNFDGTIKKSMITCEDETFNQQVTGAINAMNAWKPAVKNGVTIKSEVKLTLKYDKETKSIKPFEQMITPRPAPKCKCMSDSEMFGDE